MNKNNIREQRHKLGLTQKQLAALVGTSQQQIQRIEVGQYVKLDLAMQICAALKSPLEQVFPSIKHSITKLKKNVSSKNEKYNEEIEQAMNEAGIDTDPAHWSIRFRLRNGIEGAWYLSSKEKDRLVQCFQGPQKSFFCSTSRNTEIAINMRHLVFIQPLFDVGSIEEQAEEVNSVCIYMADSKKPLTFQVEPDDDLQEGDEDTGEFRNMLFCLDIIDDYSEEDPIINFLDADGERAFFRVEEVALIEIALWVTHPQIEDDNDHDGDNT